MAGPVIVEHDVEGRLVVRKQAAGGGAELASEVAWLRRAAGPGVVRLVGPDGEGRTDGLATEHAGSHTWRTARLGPQRAGPAAADLLRTVARLHRMGLVHGALGPDHVILGPDGPSLCSPRPGAQDAGEDRRALVELLDATARRWRDEGRAVPPGWTRARELLGRTTAGWALEDLAALVDPAQPEVPRHGGRAVRWATALRWRPGAGAGRSWRDGTWRRPAAIGVTAAAAALAVAVAGGIPGDGEPTEDVGGAGPRSGALAEAMGPGSAPVGPAGADGSAAEPSHGTGTGFRHTEQDLPAAGGYWVHGGDGRLVTVEQPCPGTPPAALLDPGTGHVWAFDTLPAAGHEVAGVAVQRVPGADRVEARHDSSGCQVIVAVGLAGEAPVPAAEPGRGAGVATTNG
jgi:hypothetical protein